MAADHFNQKAGCLFEYHVTMNEPVLSDDTREQQDACRLRAGHFSLLLNGWAIGTGDRKAGRFDAAVPLGAAKKKNALEKEDRPAVKVFCTTDVMRRLQRDFQGRILSIRREKRWTQEGAHITKDTWKHPRKAKGARTATSAPARAADHGPEGYT